MLSYERILIFLPPGFRPVLTRDQRHLHRLSARRDATSRILNRLCERGRHRSTGISGLPANTGAGRAYLLLLLALPWPHCRDRSCKQFRQRRCQQALLEAVSRGSKKILWWLSIVGKTAGRASRRGGWPLQYRTDGAAEVRSNRGAAEKSDIRSQAGLENQASFVERLTRDGPTVEVMVRTGCPSL
jgi:hypothetical protein